VQRREVARGDDGCMHVMGWWCSAKLSIHSAELEMAITVVVVVVVFVWKRKTLRLRIVVV